MSISSEKIEQFFSDRAPVELEKIAKQQRNSDLGFNIFGMVSDIYHRENFHSDILAAVLNTEGSHGERFAFLKEFIELVNRIGPVSIDSSLYTSSTVSREKGRRDITLYGKSKHAIIIENKINDAGDTFNQIPRYLQDMEDEGYTVDAIVYLTLNQNKEPDESGWQCDESRKQEIRNKLALVRAFSNDSTDLCYWLDRCSELPISDNSRFVLTQYNQLMKHLTRTQIDHDFFSKFSRYLSESPDMAQVAIGIKDSLVHYPYHILSNVKAYYKKDRRFIPFSDIKEYTQHVFFFYDYNIGGYSFNTDIIINSLDNCIIDFSVRHKVEYQQLYPQKILEIIGMIDEFEWNANGLNRLGRYEHHIGGPFIEFEQKIISFVDEFLNKLRNKHLEIEGALESL